jgi:hypothetical protein
MRHEYALSSHTARHHICRYNEDMHNYNGKRPEMETGVRTFGSSQTLNSSAIGGLEAESFAYQPSVSEVTLTLIRTVLWGYPRRSQHAS